MSHNVKLYVLAQLLPTQPLTNINPELWRNFQPLPNLPYVQGERIRS